MGYTFISYSTKNQAAADAMREFLLKNKVDVWMAPLDIPAGSRYAEVINKAIKGCSCVVLILTEASQNSTWVAKEVERAVNYRKPIIPVQMEDIILNDEFELYISSSQVVAVQKMNEESEDLSKILSSVKVFCGENQKEDTEEHQKMQNVKNIACKEQMYDRDENEQKSNQCEGLIKEKTPVKESLEDILEELNSLAGLTDAKQQIKRIINLAQLNQKLRAAGEKERNMGPQHMVFMGNPGTGKTTVARMLARIYKSLGVLPTSRYMEVSRTDLIGEFVGQTTSKTTKVVERALGGVLIIDDAYQLIRDDEDVFGKEAVNALMVLLETHKDELVCIFAGYEDEMKRLLDSNQGLRSRLGAIINFEDFNEDELMVIFKKDMQKKGIQLGSGAEMSAKTLIEAKSKLPDFGNARGIRNLCEMILQNQENRLSKASDIESCDRNTVLKEDIELLLGGKKTDRLDELMEELNGYIGLENVKKHINFMVKTAKINKMRCEMGINVKMPHTGTMHMIFTGNSGTGKSMIARLIGEIYCSLGLIPRSDVIEVCRADFVGQYVGQTAIKTAETVKKALGGVLFIDEAYTLMDKSGVSGFGREAIDTLLYLLEEHRNEFVCILAGTTKEMDEFLDQNMGLVSRFPGRIEFEDYTLDELCRLLELAIVDKGFVVTSAAKEAARKYMEACCQNRNFGNARGVRNLVERFICNASSRHESIVAAKGNITQEELITILPEDIY